MARLLEPDLDHLELDLPSVDDAIADVRRRMAIEIDATFEELISHCERPLEVVAYFLAMLELVRWGALSIEQQDPLSTIQVTHRDDAMEEELDRLTRHSEWGGAQ